MYGTAKKKRPGYLVGNLVATNWPIEKALHAILLVITKFQLNSPILAIANTKKIPGCYVSRCYVGSCGGNIVSGARAGVTGEACTYVYLYWFTFIMMVRPAP